VAGGAAALPGVERRGTGADGRRAGSVRPAGHGPAPALPARLAAVAAPVLLVAGDYDIWPTCAAVRELAALFGHAELAVLARVGHFPWVDDAALFATAVRDFVARRPPTPGG
jgi:pimeloyl-ACP methyl ester carboxylesterase